MQAMNIQLKKTGTLILKTQQFALSLNYSVLSSHDTLRDT